MENKQVPWGDYGDILWFGFAAWDEETDKLHIERTGPFTPELYLTGSSGFVFTQTAKDMYESSGLTGIDFLYKMEKRKIVRVDWQDWDTDGEIPDYYGFEPGSIGYEPESVIDDGEHDEALAREMPEFWLVSAPNKIHLISDRSKHDKSPSEYLLIEKEPPKGIDIFFGIERLGYFVTQKFKQWIDSNYSNYFEFFPIDISS